MLFFCINVWMKLEEGPAWGTMTDSTADEDDLGGGHTLA